MIPDNLCSLLTRFYLLMSLKCYLIFSLKMVFFCHYLVIWSLITVFPLFLMTGIKRVVASVLLVTAFCILRHCNPEFLHLFAAVSLPANAVKFDLLDQEPALTVDPGEHIALFLCEFAESCRKQAWAKALASQIRYEHIYLSRTHHCQVQFIDLVIVQDFFQVVV